MAVNLSPVGGAAQQFFTNNGTPLTGGKIYTYAAGTTTPQVTYTTSSGTVQHTNPIILNAAGRIATGEIWITNGVQYKFIIYTSDDILIGSYDNIIGINDTNGLTYKIYNAVGDGVTTVYILSFPPISVNSTSIYINGVYQNKNTYSLIGNVVTFSQAPPVTSRIEMVY